MEGNILVKCKNKEIWRLNIWQIVLQMLFSGKFVLSSKDLNSLNIFIDGQEVPMPESFWDDE